MKSPFMNESGTVVNEYREQFCSCLVAKLKRKWMIYKVIILFKVEKG